jgi:hypothetical protein
MVTKEVLYLGKYFLNVVLVQRFTNISPVASPQPPARSVTAAFRVGRIHSVSCRSSRLPQARWT